MTVFITSMRAQFLLDLLRDPERARQIARTGRDFVVEKYSWEACAAAYEQIYARLAAGHPPVTALSKAASCSEQH